MKTVTKQFGLINAEVDITFLNVSPYGRGRYRINGEATIKGKGTRETLPLWVITSNMSAIDSYKSDNYVERDDMALYFAELLIFQCELEILEWKLELESKETE